MWVGYLDSRAVQQAGGTISTSLGEGRTVVPVTGVVCIERTVGNKKESKLEGDAAQTIPLTGPLFLLHPLLQLSMLSNERPQNLVAQNHKNRFIVNCSGSEA